jgi:opacity protein-like surface antigen
MIAYKGWRYGAGLQIAPYQKGHSTAGAGTGSKTVTYVLPIPALCRTGLIWTGNHKNKSEPRFKYISHYLLRAHTGLTVQEENMNKGNLIALSVGLFFPALAAAQVASQQNPDLKWMARPKFEIVASVAMGHVFRFEDQGFGNHPNFGAAVELPVWRKLRFGVEMNRTFGLSPSTAKCGGILDSQRQPLPCVGTARKGVSEATAASFTASYFFGEGRIQPYLVGGLSILRAGEYRSSSIVHQGFVEFSESKLSSTGIGPTLGAGLRASISRHLSIRPEIRFSDGTALSYLNLSQWRISAGVAYGW